MLVELYVGNLPIAEFCYCKSKRYIPVRGESATGIRFGICSRPLHKKDWSARRGMTLAARFWSAYSKCSGILGK